MRWQEFAFELFAWRWPVVFLLGLLYLVPLMRLITLPISIGYRFFIRFNMRLGQWEHAVAWLRDTLGVAYLTAFAVWNLYFGFYYGWMNWIGKGGAALGLILLSVFNYYEKLKGRRKLTKFVRDFPTIHPQEFFTHLLCLAGGIRHKLPAGPYSTVDPVHLDFRQPRKGKIGPINLVKGVWSTIWLSRLSLTALKWKGREFLREVASALGVVWGSRLASLARAQVIIEGAQDLNEFPGLNIYLFNHLSFFDFALIPLVMAVRTGHSPGKAGNLPRFLLARNHFLDNPVFHRILGIGRVAQELGMVFVERRGREEEARQAIEEAAHMLVHEGADVAIFPQGTRAHGRVGSTGERIDPGFYAVGGQSRLKRDGDHLKKGAAHLAVNAALTLLHEGIEAEVNLVPVAIKGTGIIAPRGSLRLIPNVTVRLKVGEPIVVRAVEVEGLSDEKSYDDFIRRLHQRIDHVMKSAIMVHADLERRFFEDMRGLVEPLYIEEMAIAMKPWRGDDFLIHAILDLIYTCRPQDWRPLLGRLIHLVRTDATREDLLTFKGEVAQRIAS